MQRFSVCHVRKVCLCSIRPISYKGGVEKSECINFCKYICNNYRDFSRDIYKGYFKEKEIKRGDVVMSEMKGEEYEITFEEFLQELKREVEFHTNGGTSYRQQTARLSLDIANRVAKVTPFYKLEDAKEIVSKIFPNLDRYRVEDITKMMHVIARELRCKVNMPDELSKYVQEKRNKNRKPLSFVKRHKAGKENDN